MATARATLVGLGVRLVRRAKRHRKVDLQAGATDSARTAVPAIVPCMKLKRLVAFGLA
jgi:hypothetical protein